MLQNSETVDVPVLPSGAHRRTMHRLRRRALPSGVWACTLRLRRECRAAVGARARARGGPGVRQAQTAVRFKWKRVHGCASHVPRMVTRSRCRPLRPSDEPCTACSSCGAGKHVVEQCTISSDATCGNCATGYFSTDVSPSCKECAVCPAGEQPLMASERVAGERGA